MPVPLVGPATRAQAEAHFADVRAMANGLIFRLDEAVRPKDPTAVRQPSDPLEGSPDIARALGYAGE